MNTKTLIIGLVAIIIIIGGVYIVGKSSNLQSSGTSNTMVIPSIDSQVSDGSNPNQVRAVDQINTGTPETSTSGNADNLKLFKITAQNFSFDPKEIRVKKGDTVKITLNNVGGVHDWVIDEFNAKTPKIKDGETADIQFVADKSGTFEYYCSVGTHRQMGMVGKLIVE